MVRHWPTTRRFQRCANCSERLAVGDRRTCSCHRTPALIRCSKSPVRTVNPARETVDGASGGGQAQCFSYDVRQGAVTLTEGEFDGRRRR